MDRCYSQPMIKMSKLQWRCRRGARELDMVLQAWLAENYPVATESQREAFSDLLAREDPSLFDLLLGRTEASTEPEREVVRQLRAIVDAQGRGKA